MSVTNITAPANSSDHGFSKNREKYSSARIGLRGSTTAHGHTRTLPLYERPSLGGSDTLRGYIANRFTDNSTWHAVAEYRFWIISRGFALTDTIRIERVGMALFYEAGTVADSLDRLPAARVHTSYGVGLRFSLERTAVFRADVGFSREGVNR